MVTMKFQHTFASTITCLLAIFLSVCTALPINVTSIASNHASELIIGVVALICISVAIVACTCCHRNKSGFKEFENENTLTYNTNSSSRSEFPIFRAITPSTLGHHHQHHLNSSNSSESAIIVDNRTPPNDLHAIHLDVEHNLNNIEYNNNGPISTADLENIQNNNAVDYIPSCYEIEANQRQRTHEQHVGEAVTDRHVGPRVPNGNLSDDRFVFESEMVPSSSGDFDDFYLERAGSMKGRNIDLLSDDSVEEALRVLDSAISGGESFLFDDPDDSDMEYNSSHICGTIDEEDLHSDNFTLPSQFEAIAVIENFDAKDITSLTDNDNGAHALNCTEPMEQNAPADDDVREASTSLVDSVLAAALAAVESMRLDGANAVAGDTESQMPIVDAGVGDASAPPETEPGERPALDDDDTAAVSDANDPLRDDGAEEKRIEPPIEGAIVDQLKRELSPLDETAVPASDTVVVDEAAEVAAEVATLNDKTANESAILDDFDDSLSETFVSGRMVASTPCHRNVMTTNCGGTSNPVCLFQALDELSECELSADGIGLLHTTPNNPINGTFDAVPLMDHTAVLRIDGKPDVSACSATDATEAANGNGNVAADLVTAKSDTFIQSETIALNGTFVANGTFLANGTFVANANNETFVTNETFGVKADNDTFVKNGNETFVANEDRTLTEPGLSDADKSNPIIKIDKDEVASDDLTTITPMNTPIELNYVGDSWDKFVSNSSKRPDQSSTDDDQLGGNSSWYLHPHKPSGANLTFDMNETDGAHYDGMDDDSESLEENPELLSLTFDALRKQLADVLPHASVRPSIDYSDDEDEYNGSDSDPECDDPAMKAINSMLRLSLKPPNQDDLQADVVINYKQQLSPIMEESEDETCKTFVFNETKCVDSTSTGCIGTSEAIMGVTKVLMASNDTLFNFEDTLGDRDDMFSPRHLCAASGGSSSSTPQPPVECKTPTNERSAAAADDLSEETPTLNEPLAKRTVPMSLSFDTNAANLTELMSPEQQKTFSEDIQTLEQVSSDLSATVEGNTNTLDDLKTCISVHFNDETNKADNRPDAYGLETVPLADDDSLDERLVPVNDGTLQDAGQPAHSVDDDSSMQSSLDSLESVEAAKRTNNRTIMQCQNIGVIAQENGSGVSDKADMHALSGEEDPWASHSMLDVVYAAHDKHDRQQEYVTNDWDSDIEDSNSSEEFVYTKETTDLYEYMQNHSSGVAPLAGDAEPTAQPLDGGGGSASDDAVAQAGDRSPAPTDAEAASGDEHSGAQEIWNVWNSHEDLIAVSTNAGAIDSADDMLDESSLSENEDEWVPSSWDSLAKPVRSALKSPDKSSSEEETSPKAGSKNRRNVVFKKQNYHSVYEYPKESAAISPTVNETKMWANYLANSSPFSSSVSDSYLNNDTDVYYGSKHSVDFNALDGFTVSSSSRPFHISQYTNECHTWPTDAEFSWSQFQNTGKLNGMERAAIDCEPIEWKFHSDQTNNDKGDPNAEPNDTNKSQAADHQSNEAAEMISDKLSLGELCHTKASLRLPLNVYVATVSDAKAQTQATPADEQIDSSKTNSQQDYSETSYTGSMDSINSLDGSKITQNHSDAHNTNADGLTTAVCDGLDLAGRDNGAGDHAKRLDDAGDTFRESGQPDSGHGTDASVPINGTKLLKCDLRSSANRQSDSTDEDSGIENIRIAKDI